MHPTHTLTDLFGVPVVICRHSLATPKSGPFKKTAGAEELSLWGRPVPRARSSFAKVTEDIFLSDPERKMVDATGLEPVTPSV